MLVIVHAFIPRCLPRTGSGVVMRRDSCVDFNYPAVVITYIGVLKILRSYLARFDCEMLLILVMAAPQVSFRCADVDDVDDNDAWRTLLSRRSNYIRRTASAHCAGGLSSGLSTSKHLGLIFESS